MVTLIFLGVAIAVIGKILSYKPKARHVEAPRPIYSRSTMHVNGVESDVHCPNCGRFM